MCFRLAMDLHDACRPPEACINMLLHEAILNNNLIYSPLDTRGSTKCTFVLVNCIGEQTVKDTSVLTSLQYQLISLYKNLQTQACTHSLRINTTWFPNAWRVDKRCDWCLLLLYSYSIKKTSKPSFL